MADPFQPYRVKPGSRLKLSEHDPDDLGAYAGGKEKGQAELLKLNERLEQLQGLLYAEHKHRVLVVLQAMDAGGKDGTIRVVFDRVNPQGVQVASFGVPTPAELDHDYLWRVHPHVPGKGEIAIFNRSHYEDVLVVRVKSLVPEPVWRRRYAHIRDFERMLAEEGTTILKFFLHISKDEQKKRLQERLDDPAKRWKFRKGDLDDRALWDDYMRAYEDALSETSTDHAPWYVIPGNRNWYRNLVISRVLIEALEGLNMKYPEPEEGLEGIRVE